MDLVRTARYGLVAPLHAHAARADGTELFVLPRYWFVLSGSQASLGLRAVLRLLILVSQSVLFPYYTLFDTFCWYFKLSLVRVLEGVKSVWVIATKRSTG